MKAEKLQEMSLLLDFYAGLLTERQRELYEYHRAMFYEENKPLGFEVFDIRHANELVFHLIEQEYEERTEDNANQDAGDEDDVGIGADGLFGDSAW